MCDSGKGEIFCEGSKKKWSARKISRCARNDGGGNGFISRSVQRICLENAIHAMSSRAKPSIFLAHRYSAVCETAENGKPFAKEARKSRVQGGFLDCAQNDGMGMDGSPYAPLSYL